MDVSCACGCGEVVVPGRKYRQGHWSRTPVAQALFAARAMPKPPPKPQRRGVAHHSWKGGRTMRRGYVMLNMPDHPRADSKGYVAEHIVVWEEANGRKL